MSENIKDAVIRKVAFDWLVEQIRIHGDVLPRTLLSEGFEFEGVRVPLLGPQGIFKPKVLDIPISITTVPSGPYDDGFSQDGLLLYKYRGSDPNHRDNRGLRYAMESRIPLVYFHRIIEGKYLTIWPIFIVGDDPDNLTFKVEVDDASYASVQSTGELDGLSIRDDGGEARRSYITATVRQRVHQRSFRERVLRAYSEQCALCNLKHEELLDAAHIIPDGEPDGDPIVPNGLALCKLHHAAFDRQFLGIRPDYIIEVRPDILQESDGPMLRHGLQGLHGSRIYLPRSKRERPEPRFLERRYEQFISVSEKPG